MPVTCALAPTKTAEQQVIDSDDDYVKAELSHDEGRIRRLIDDRFVYNDEDGKTIDKEVFVERVVKLPIVGQTIRERSVVVEGDVGLVFATTDLRFAAPGGAERITSLRYTCAYVRRDGVWRMLALQMQSRAKEESTTTTRRPRLDPADPDGSDHPATSRRPPRRDG